jgi:hypothetical protein
MVVLPVAKSHLRSPSQIAGEQPSAQSAPASILNGLLFICHKLFLLALSLTSFGFHKGWSDSYYVLRAFSLVTHHVSLDANP